MIPQFLQGSEVGVQDGGVILNTLPFLRVYVLLTDLLRKLNVRRHIKEVVQQTIMAALPLI